MAQSSPSWEQPLPFWLLLSLLQFVLSVPPAQAIRYGDSLVERAGLTLCQAGQVVPHWKPLLCQANGTSFFRVIKLGYTEAWSLIWSCSKPPCVFSHVCHILGGLLSIVSFDSPFASVLLMSEFKGTFIQYLSVQVLL